MNILPVLVALVHAGFGIAAPATGAAERKPIVFVLPAGATSGWVHGTVSFPPSVLKSVNSIRLWDFKSGREVPGVVVSSRAWFDGSVMSAGIAFRASKDQERRIWAEWGQGVKGTLKPGRAPWTAKPVEFRFFEEGDDVKLQGEVNVGTLVVRVERNAGIYYWWYLVPIAGIVGFVLWRKLRLRHG